MKEYASLNELGILSGSDASSLGHGYLRHYEAIFRPLQNAPINLVQLGIDRGRSFRMWAEYFTRGVIIGVDSRPDQRWHGGDRRIIEIGPLDDNEFLREIGRLYRPSVIIDNGLREPKYVKAAFEIMFPLLRDGGYYIAERINFHTDEVIVDGRGGPSLTLPEYFLRFARFTGCPASQPSIDPQLIGRTDTITFFYGAVALKCKPVDAVSDPISAHRELVRRADDSRTWANFSQLILNNGGNPEEAIAACQRAVELEPMEPSLYHCLSIAMERGGDLDGAIRASERSRSLDPVSDMFRNRLMVLTRVARESP